jgi:mono/diheme cytochrome c family protein
MGAAPAPRVPTAAVALRRGSFTWLLFVLLAAREASSAGLAPAGPRGAELYAEACATCHGADGRGAAGTGVDVPLPDFTDCSFVTPESTSNWIGLVRHGGRFLGLSSQMPAFGHALTDDEIQALIAYVRSFCRDPRYPTGDLNYRRPFLAEKAFPEDELLVVTDFERARRSRAGTTELVVERRIAARGQVEVAAPASWVDPEDASPTGGVGDIAVAYKHALVVLPELGSIVAAGGELVTPTGNRHDGVGSGTWVGVPKLLVGQRAGPFVLQGDVRAELPADPARADRRLVWTAALQYPLGPYTRSPVPLVELEYGQGLARGVRDATLLAPGLYLPLSRRGHVAVAASALVPIAGTRPFDWGVGGFLLWEYGDGPFFAW